MMTERKLTCSLDALIMHASLADVLAYAAAMAQREALEATDCLEDVTEFATVAPCSNPTLPAIYA